MYKFWNKLSSTTAIRDSWYTEKEYKEPRKKVTLERRIRGQAIHEIMEMMRNTAPFNEYDVRHQLQGLSKERLTQVLNDWNENENVSFIVI